MTTEQEKIAESFINALKNNNGHPLNWRDFSINNNISKQLMNIVVQSLKEPDWDLLKESAPGSTMTLLTKKGFDFIDFATYKQGQQKEKDRQDEIIDLTLRKLKLEQFPAKFWWLILLISAIISIATTVISTQISRRIMPQDPIQKEQSLSPSGDSTKNR